MVDITASLCGLNLTNPVIPASGCFGFGVEFAEYYDINILGSFCTKGTTRLARFGNDTPRIAETPSGMLNSVGLQNPGIAHVVKHELNEIKSYYNKPVIANISGFSVDEFAYCAEMLNSCDNVGIIEVNISCPNVHGGGMSFGTDAGAAASVTRAVRAVTKKPIMIKLSPNVTNISLIAKAVESSGADAVCLINTLMGMRINLATRKPLLANKTGGLSGSAVFPVALRMVYEVYEAVRIPIVGVGGISSANDVIEMMLAGTCAVEVGAANLVNPYACRDIIDNLPAAAEKLGISKLRDIIGQAHNRKEP